MSRTFLGIPGLRRPGDHAPGRHAAPGGTAGAPPHDEPFGPVPHPAEPLRWGPSFPDAAKETLKNAQMRRNLAHATSTIRAKRARVVDEVTDWEALRDAGSALKERVMDDLPELLEELERNVTTRGGVVHWARDAAEANRIVAGIVKAKGADEVVKVKSMATQEIGLNEALAEEGIAAVETDLAELIVQLADDMPSHILVPAIHRNRSEIRDIFLARMGDAPADLSDVPRELAMAARAHLRRKFLSAKVAVSGANFAVASTGTLAVVESEGNGRMCLTLPETLVTVMGIEKLVPSYEDLEVFLQLLPRSSTGERMNPYTSLWTGVTPGDGPQEFHLVLLDNGRTSVLADEVGRAALHCIRCSACLNVCPVYERVGGHAYGSVYPGPIGAILTPQLTASSGGVSGQLNGHGDPNSALPYASTLCGACYDVCPVKIDIPSILVDLRTREVDADRSRVTLWGAAMKAASFAMADGKRFALAEKPLRAGRVLARDGVIGRLPYPASAWTDSRDLPVPPKQTFRQWWAERDAPAAPVAQEEEEK
ncbi:LutB/LldF family L-lactate oxidation iron-sulfur protein [Antribacter gilvus]|uniref:LutB/LldF family L-lactate oxidation iron-sulfur protein n=1 Tax=Antribacter gilvus TaxID=2304675 RepID=UPI000F77E558|nr:LutB/LldF family L-lactate oxidation iron-sulfur protein [Antribacter gilvus]